MIRKTLSMAFVALFMGVAVTLAGLDATPILNHSFESISDPGNNWGYEIDDWYTSHLPATQECFWENGSSIGLVGDGLLWSGVADTDGKFYQDVGTVDDGVAYEITALIGSRWGTSFGTGTFSLYASADTASATNGVPLNSFATLLSSINVTTNSGVATGDVNVWTVAVNLPTGTGHDGEVLWLEFGSAGGKDYFDNIVIAPSAAATPPAPVWTEPVTSSTGIVAVAYSDTLAGKAIDAAGDAITYGITTSPAWLSVHPTTGALSGTPDVFGENTFTVTASDGTGTSSATLSLYIRASLPPEWTEPVTSGAATINEPYSGTLDGKATDPDGQSISYSLTDTNTWLDVASDGTLSGTPTGDDEGTNTFAVVADDGLDAPVSTTLTIVVIPKDYTIAWNFAQRNVNRMVQGDGEIFGTSQWTDSVNPAAPEWTRPPNSDNEWAITTPQNVPMVSVAWSAANLWNAGDETTLEDQLFKMYLDDGGAGPSATISGLTAWMTAAGAFGYEITIYQNSDAGSNVFPEFNIYEGAGVNGTLLENFAVTPSDGSGSGGGSRLIRVATGTFTADIVTLHTDRGLGGGNRASISAFKITPILIPGPGAQVTDLVISGPYAGGMELSWTGENGKPYGVETNDNLILTGGWASWITGQQGNGGMITVTNTIDSDQIFYRVISEVPSE